MDCKEIVVEYLKANGFDGLAGEGCGCSIEDFGCCDESFGDCVPAYARKCIGEQCAHSCDAYDGAELTSCFSTEKPREAPDGR